jgi:hypothetical protein
MEGLRKTVGSGKNWGRHLGRMGVVKDECCVSTGSGGVMETGWDEQVIVDVGRLSGNHNDILRLREVAGLQREMMWSGVHKGISGAFSTGSIGSSFAFAALHRTRLEEKVVLLVVTVSLEDRARASF